MKLFNFQKAKFPGYMKEKGNIELNQSDICSELFFHGDIADWTVSNKIQSVNFPFSFLFCFVAEMSWGVVGTQSMYWRYNGLDLNPYKIYFVLHGFRQHIKVCYEE